MNELTFSRNEAGQYEASFVADGATTIQLQRSEEGSIKIYANLDGMDKKYIGGYGAYEKGDYRNMLFTLDVIPGMTVTVVSEANVESAMLLSGSEVINGLLEEYKEVRQEALEAVDNANQAAADANVAAENANSAAKKADEAADKANEAAEKADMSREDIEANEAERESNEQKRTEAEQAEHEAST